MSYRGKEVAAAFVYSTEGVNVEVGCGGRKINPSFIGVDPVPKGQIATLGQPCVAEYQGTASELADFFEPESVDRIFALHSIHYEPDFKFMFEVFHYVLKPRGKVIIIDLLPETFDRVDFMQQFEFNYNMSPQHLLDCAIKQGFSLEKSTIVNPGWSFMLVVNK